MKILPAVLVFFLIVGTASAYKVVPPENLLGAKAVKNGKVPLQKKVKRIAPDPRLANQDLARTFSEGCVAWRERVDLPACVYGNPASSRRVVLLGDSKAMQFFPALEKVALTNDWRLTHLVRVNCTPALVRVEDKYCNKWREKTLRRIVRRERPYLVIISSATKKSYQVQSNNQLLSREASQSHLRQGMIDTIRKLQLAGAEVVVLRDQALAPLRPSQCVAKNYKKLLRCAYQPKSRTTRAFEVPAAKWTGAKILDPQKAFCAPDVCPAVIGNMAVYSDNYHITATFSATLDEWFLRRLPSL